MASTWTRARKIGHIVEDGKAWSLWIVCAILFLTSALIVILKGDPDYIQITPFHAQVSHQAPAKNWYNLLMEEPNDYTSALLKLMRLNSTESASNSSDCYRVSTNSTKLEGLPEPVDGKFLFRTDTVHYLTLVAYGTNGQERCAGGDYYEVDFHDRDNVFYRSRLPTVDFGNGSYGLELVVPARFAGAFRLEIWLLFTNWHGMDHKTERWVRQKLVFTQELELIAETPAVKVTKDSKINQHEMKANLTRCTQADFDRNSWQGRWTRSWFNPACQADRQKRFHCLPEDHYLCEEPWCFGPVGRLESNGWHYSAHCSFKVFQREEAWECLSGKWFFIWGDSNFQDTIRNLLLFILEWELPKGKTVANFQLERTYEAGFINPRRYDQEFRVSQHFNGANEPWIYGAGLNTLEYEKHQQTLLAHFNGTTWPDTIIMNSGLHDGDQFDRVSHYAATADYAIQWWLKLYASIPAGRKPQLIWRTTIAPAGISRKMNANPNKMEMFNQVIVEKLQRVRHELPVKFVDGFDLTFPFHYNNDFSDGGHYGRAPGVKFRPWYGRPHWYFVDLMLAHILLNAACPSTV